jgi:hypothetical protein
MISENLQWRRLWRRKGRGKYKRRKSNRTQDEKNVTMRKMGIYRKVSG